MTAKQMEMYMDGTSEKMVAEAKAYEVEQYRKAFYKGTDAAWKTYRRNVQRKVNEINKITGIGLLADALMR